MNVYSAIKHLHVGSVYLSLALFVFRGALMLRESPWLKTRMLLVFPHVVDTVLLVSALWLTVLIGQYPFTTAWLTVKVLLLVVYILLGSIALRWGRTRTVRVTAFAGAVCVFLFIISVARTHHPLGALYILR